ncbi:hypothetical protein [Teichococcus aerofrigidensis]
MFHHRSCGAAQIVALMAAHRDARKAATGLCQKDIDRLLEALSAAAGGEADSRAAASPPGGHAREAHASA